MRILDRYDYDLDGKERYLETKFFEGKDEYLGKSHTYSYLMIRNMKKDMGQIMGLEKELTQKIKGNDTAKQVVGVGDEE